MFRYTLFGGCLHSALEFPGLPASSSPDDSWRLRVGSPADALPTGPQLGSEQVDAGCAVSLHRQADGLRLRYDDTGSFDVAANGRDIVWYPAPGAQLDLARLDVIGRVLSTAFHVVGILPLHGSAVTVAGRAIAFVAPKTFGKSTLALALVNQGAGFLSDDTVPVEPGVIPMARPGVDHVRLWGDSAMRLVARERMPKTEQGNKHTLSVPASATTDRTPMAAVYLLAPTNGDVRRAAASRTRLGSVPAALALVRHAKLGSLLGGEEAARLLDQATAVARVVPVYLLEIARDLDRLAEAVAAIMAWHSVPLSASPEADHATLEASQIRRESLPDGARAVEPAVA